MALLPPPHHAPLPVAAVYLLAEILHAETNRPEGAPAGECFRRYALPSARLRSSPLERIAGVPHVPLAPQLFSLVVAAIDLIRDAEQPDNPYLITGVRVRFKDRDGRRFCEAPEHGSMSAEPLYQFETVLKPPFTDCLTPTSIRSTINTGLARAVAPIPDALEIRIPDFTHDAVARYRQALAVGSLGAVLLEDSGRITPIPAHWWRCEVAEGAFVESASVAIDMEGRQATGVPYVNRACRKPAAFTPR